MLRKDLLEERLRSNETFQAKKKSSRIHLPSEIRNPPHINYVIKSFYEELSRMIFAGEELFVDSANAHPDAADVERARYIEVKAVGRARRLMLKDDQISSYLRLQNSNSPVENPRIYFTIYRYGIRGIWGLFEDKTPREIFGALSKETKFMIGLPFSLIYLAHSFGREEFPPACLSRSYGRGIPATHFSSTLIDSFFENPGYTIQKIFGLNLDEFRIRHYKSDDDLRLNRFKVSPFPIVLIKDLIDFRERER